MVFCIPCWIPLIILLVMSIFSARYRRYLKEAKTCFVKNLKGERCTSTEDKMRETFSNWLSKKGCKRISKWFSVKSNFTLFVTVVFIIVNLISLWMLLALIVSF